MRTDIDWTRVLSQAGCMLLLPLTASILTGDDRPRPAADWTQPQREAVKRMQQRGTSIDTDPRMSVYFRNGGPTETDLKDMRLLPDPEFVILIGHTVCDEHLGRLLTRGGALRSLYILDTKVTDAGLAGLSRLPHLGRLNLRGTPVTDKGLERLRGAQSLYKLGLSKTRVTDRGLKSLRDLQLLSLDLRDTSVSDAGLEHLVEMPSLILVHLAGTKVTDAGIQKLLLRRPHLQVSLDQGTGRTNAGAKGPASRGGEVGRE